MDAGSINGDEISISGTGVGSAVLSGTATLVSGTTYRYGFTGDFVDGPVDVGLVAGSFQDLAATPNLNAQDAWSFTADTPQVIETQIIDNGESGFSNIGAWTVYSGQGYNNSIKSSAAGSGADVATWTFTDLAAGQYQVSATWAAHANRATDAPYRILDGTTEVFSTTVNQEITPLADAVDAGRTFQNLGGVVTINSGTLVVQLSDDANQYVIADAVRIEKIVALPAAAAAEGEELQSVDSRDVNRDGRVTALDALLVLNQLSRSGGISDVAFDTNQDDTVSAVDVLNIINHIGRSSDAEAEQPIEADRDELFAVLSQGDNADWLGMDLESEINV